MTQFDIPLLRTFVQVVDSGGFARAGGRVYRSQSTVSQQIKKLEAQAGRPLLLRNARATSLTPDGERLLGYARRMLALHDEVCNLFAEDLPELVRIGLPEDYAVQLLPYLLAEVAQHHPQARLEVRSQLSVQLQAALADGELDIALYRRVVGNDAPGQDDAHDTWPDALQWVAASGTALERQSVLPLVLFPHGCVYRAHALAQLEQQGRRWRVAYTSPNMAGVLAAVQAGLGVSLQSRQVLAHASGLRELGPGSGLPPAPSGRFVLRSAAGPAGPARQAVLQRLRALLAQSHVAQAQHSSPMAGDKAVDKVSAASGLP
ncbi:LysR substrate-binding domain-containing protein [Vandammella animalimorsus]|nr:LysR substrate-binding domain-containing protein [Vandammella animalimorsus]